MTVPTSAHLSHSLSLFVQPLSGLGSVLLARFNFPVRQSVAGCATKLLKSVFVDSAVKCINFPSLSLIWYSGRWKKRLFSVLPTRMPTYNK